MIVVELHEPWDSGYRTVATLTVDDDGRTDFADPDCRFPMGVHVIVPQDDGSMRPVTLEDDASVWARHLDTVLRTGYLVPVVVRDDEASLR